MNLVSSQVESVHPCSFVLRRAVVVASLPSPAFGGLVAGVPLLSFLLYRGFIL